VVHQQNATPGLGARVAEDAWQSLWQGKKIASADGTIRIRVVKGDGSGPYEVDGISGATRTSSGVSNLIRFWMGNDGYGPYLDRLEQEGGG
jgi:Na+-transporting NADH:ubiquinone oxidoreductase subunit C